MSIPTSTRLSALYLHALNTRSDPPDAEIEELAGSIRSIGLLQNLSGYADPARPGEIGIVAGGRRLRALQLIHAGEDPAIPVHVTEDAATAEAWAGAENSARKALDPVDEIRAYRRMVEDGGTPDAVARAFAVSVKHVQQRLKLSKLHPDILLALAQRQIRMDQAEALCEAETAEAALAVMERDRERREKGWQPLSYAEMHRMLTPNTVPGTDRRAVFVGLDYYRARGGEAQGSLFSSDIRLKDEELLNDLFLEKLAETAEEIREEGYRSVIITDKSWISYPSNARLLARPVVELPEADAAELERLTHEYDERELSEADEQRRLNLEARRSGVYDPEEVAQATVIIGIDNDGDLIRSIPFTTAAPKVTAAQEDGSPTAAKAEKVSQAVVDDMRILRRIALQSALIEKPELMLDLLTLSLTAPIYQWHKPLAISPVAQSLTPSKEEGLIVSERLQTATSLIENKIALQDLHPGHLSEVQAMGKQVRNATLTAALAAIFCRSDGDFTDHLAETLGVNVRKIWTPTAAGYFSRIPVAMLDRIWAALVPADRSDPAEFAAMKKAEKARDLDALFNDLSFREALQLDRETNKRIDAWLPAELRFGRDDWDTQ